jgi:serine/threonine protein kinase
MSATELNCPFCGFLIKLESPQTVLKGCPSCGKAFHSAAKTAVKATKETAVFSSPSPPPEPKETSLPGMASHDSRLNLKKLGPYRIERNIGRGGMGFVYEAIDTRLNRRVALKTVESGEGANEQMVSRFRQESKSAAKLRHANIVPIHDVGQDGNFDYFTMDLVEGVTLDRWVSSASASYQMLATIMEKVSRAIHHAHEQGVIHRDIKPGNVMIDLEGEPQVMDFGLARNIKDTSSITLSGSILGTPAYMAPEQTVGPLEDIGVLSDIWALGVVFYEILTGKSPFDRGNVYQTIYAVSQTDPELPRKVEPQIPADLETIVMKCLQKRGMQRYQTAKALADDIRAWLEDRPISARPPTFFEKFVKLFWRQKAIPIDDFMQEQKARQNAEAQKVELEMKVKTETKRDWILAFEDEFKDFDVTSRWNIYGGKWEVKNEELHLSGGEPQVMYLKKPLSGDLKIEFECHLESEFLTDISCFMNALPLKNPKKACDSGYMFQYGAVANTRIFVERPKNRLWDMKASPLVKGKRYRVVAEKSNSHLKLTVNDEVVFDVEDEAPLAGAERNLLGLYGWVSDAWYSHVKIYQLGTPQKADVLDVAQRQLDHGHYAAACDLFEEISNSTEDPLRRDQAKVGLQKARYKMQIAEQLPGIEKRILEAWPEAKLKMGDHGLILEISNLKIRDLSILKGMPLTELDCTSNQIESLEPLRGMQLSSLHCNNNQVSSLEALEGMPLKTLLVANNQISKLDPLKGMSLSLLNCNGNPVADLEPLRGLPLIWFYCEDSKVTSLDPIKGMPLKGLYCSRNEITSLEPLRGMAITSLRCAHNRIVSLEPLKGIPLDDFRCYDNQMVSLSPFTEDSPPPVFYWDSDTIPDLEIQRAVSIWKKEKKSEHNFRNAETLLALRKKDYALLKSLAKEFQGHCYLFIPKMKTFDDAQNLCRDIGGHLAIPNTEAKRNFIEAFRPRFVRWWVGLRAKNGVVTWINGDPFDDTLFPRSQKGSDGVYVSSGTDMRLYDPSQKNYLMVEWDMPLTELVK